VQHHGLIRQKIFGRNGHKTLRNGFNAKRIGLAAVLIEPVLNFMGIKSQLPQNVRGAKQSALNRRQTGQAKQRAIHQGVTEKQDGNGAPFTPACNTPASSRNWAKPSRKPRAAGKIPSIARASTLQSPLHGSR